VQLCSPNEKHREQASRQRTRLVRVYSIRRIAVTDGLFDRSDTQAQPKPHFAAIHPPPPRLAPAVLQPISTSASARPRPSLIPNPRSSLLPNAIRLRAQTKGGRVSAFSGAAMGFSASTSGRRRSSAGGAAVNVLHAATMTEKEIDERVCCAVISLG
jgi:kinesin family protein 22